MGKKTELSLETEDNINWNNPDTERQTFPVIIHLWTLKGQSTEKWSRTVVTRDWKRENGWQ